MSLEALQAENERLRALLEAHGIEWQLPSKPALNIAPIQETSILTPQEKVTLFCRLFRGRTDVYPLRWESKATGKSGYSPACANEWRAGICEKPRIKCSDCTQRALKPLTDTVIYEHLVGQHIVGIYPLLSDDTCYFLAVDFDEAEWREDVKAFIGSCRELNIPAVVEISRSGEGAHVWIFFSEAVAARDARRLGTALISHACARTRQMNLSSYDRLFPNQDTMPKGGFGNLIALPLQKKSRENGGGIFVDDNLVPYPCQWQFLASISLMSPQDLASAILCATGGTHPLDVNFIDEEDNHEPWKKQSLTTRLPTPLPDSLTVILANHIYIEKAKLTQPLTNRLIRLAAFQNPEFYKAQAMRFPVWDKPRVIGCAENYPNHIALPRGCLDAMLALMQDNAIHCELVDERFEGMSLNDTSTALTFAGQLRQDQEVAVQRIQQHDIGVLCAPTAFGKTVVAAKLIVERGVNTLILVHRAELLNQWKERLMAFLQVGKDTVGSLGAGKAKLTGKIDIALMQSLSRRGEVNVVVENYGHIIVDECHHIGAVSFSAILKQVKAKYVLGLTATPIRRDGQQPIIFMQCGPLRHTVVHSERAPQDLSVTPVFLYKKIDLPREVSIQELFGLLAKDLERVETIITKVEQAYQDGRKILVLTERVEHLEAILTTLTAKGLPSLVLHGKLSKKQRAQCLSDLEALAENAPRILLATGKLVGEGFDHPPLDTLILAMPISWRGTLQQYAGRLHRECISKTDVRIFDFVDTDHPALFRMWEKRQRGYRAMGYRIE